MKTKILSIIALLAAAIGFGSCSDNWEPNSGRSGQVALKDHLGVAVDDIQKEVESRASYNVDDFVVTILNAQGAVATFDGEEASWSYSAMPEIFSLEPGDYTVQVKSHDVAKSEWEKPYYLGSKEFKIESNTITEIGTVTCKFASIRVSVIFTDELVQAMGDDVQVRVILNDQGELTFSPSETRSGYYEAVEGSNTMAAYFTGTVNGYKENFHKAFSDVEAGQHRKITFSLKQNPDQPDPETGTIDPTNGISVDITVDQVDENGNVIPEEDADNDQDRPNSDEQFGDDIDAVYDAASATVKVTASADIKALVLALASDNADATAAFAGINGADLANPGAAASALTGYGIANGSAVAGQKAVDVALSQLIAALKEYEGNHSVTLTVTDTKDNTASATANVKGNGGVEPIEFTSALRFDTPMNPSDEKDGVVNISVPAGIAHLVVDINSDNDDFQGIVSGAGISGADFAYPGALAETLTGFGLANGDAVLNQTSVDFDITMFLSPAFLPGFIGRHEFKLNVEDNNGNKKSATLIFVVQ